MPRELGNCRGLDYGPGPADRGGSDDNVPLPVYPALCLATLVAATIATSGPARAADPMGTWYTADKDSEVRITNCGGALCGALVWLKEPNDPATGRPKTDKNNADATKQSRPLWACRSCSA